VYRFRDRSSRRLVGSGEDEYLLLLGRSELSELESDIESESDAELLGLVISLRCTRCAVCIDTTYGLALRRSFAPATALPTSLPLPSLALAALRFSFPSSASNLFLASSFAFNIRSATPLPLVRNSSGTSVPLRSFGPPPSANWAVREGRGT
jgi:hypothetical protein